MEGFYAYSGGVDSTLVAKIALWCFWAIALCNNMILEELEMPHTRCRGGIAMK